MVYNLDWKTSGTAAELPNKDAINLVPQQVDINRTSLVLFGKGAPNYGEGLQENLIRILENFAAPTAPANATIGQLWFDSSENTLKILDVASVWVPISGVWVGETAPANPRVGQLWFIDSSNKLSIYGGGNVWVPLNDNPRVNVAYNYEYNRLVEQFNAIVAGNHIGTSCADSYGWNQASMALSKLFLPANPVTNADWAFLMNKWKDAANVVGVDPNKFENTGFILHDQYSIDETPGPNGESKGIVTAIMDYERAVNAAAEVYANRFNFKATALDLLNFPAINRPSYWSGKTYLNLEFKWANLAAMDQFFMTGGFLKLSPTFSPGVNDLITQIWSNLMASIGGGIFIKACGSHDGNNNPEFSKYVSVFQIPTVAVGTPWLQTASPGSVGVILYRAYEKLTAAMGGAGLDDSNAGYGGYTSPSSYGVVTYGGLNTATGTTLQYGGTNQSGISVNFSGIQTDGAPSSGFNMGNDDVPGWADITVEARKLNDGTLQFHITFDNEISTGGVPAQVKGNLACNMTTYKASANWGSLTPSVVSTHPSIVTANSLFI